MVKKKEINVLGLDISTTSIGASVVKHTESNCFLLYASYISFPQKTNLYERAIIGTEKITNLITEYKISRLHIEKPPLFFKSGFSTANTVIKLASFSFLMSWEAYKIIGNEIYWYFVESARKNVWGSTFRELKSSREKKEKVLELALEKYENLKSFINYKTKKEFMYILDVADSITLASIRFDY